MEVRSEELQGVGLSYDRAQELGKGQLQNARRYAEEWFSDASKAHDAEEPDEDEDPEAYKQWGQKELLLM